MEEDFDNVLHGSHLDTEVNNSYHVCHETVD
jgi:hypothetical protein